MRICKTCGDTKPSTEFYTNSAKKDGLFSSCKTCTKERNSSFRKREREQDVVAKRLPSVPGIQKIGNSWKVRISFQGKRHHIGSFKSEKLAVERLNKERQHLGLDTFTENIVVTDLEDERWEPSPIFGDKYFVSSMGRVKSTHNRREILLKQFKSKRHLMVRLCLNGKSKIRTVHLLVAEAFLGHLSNGRQEIVVDHKDNNPLNNSLSNLQLISQRENSIKDKKPNKSGYTGVTKHSKTGLFFARIYINKEKKYLGYFKTAEEASEAYQKELKFLTKNKQL